jgi:guanylate kinase
MFNPLIEVLFGQKTPKTKDTKFQHEWKRNGVLKNDVSNITEWGKVALIECSLTEAMKIHSTYHQQCHECNYIFVRPPTSEELEMRLMRDVERMESYSSIQ